MPDIKFNEFLDMPTIIHDEFGRNRRAINCHRFCASVRVNGVLHRQAVVFIAEKSGPIEAVREKAKIALEEWAGRIDLKSATP